MCGKICGTKSRRRQRTKYTDSLNNYVARNASSNNELIRRIDDREGWEVIIAGDLAHDEDDDDDDDDDDDYDDGDDLYLFFNNFYQWNFLS